MKLPVWLTAAASAVGAALLPACDGIHLKEIQPGISRAEDVLARLGEPGARHLNPDGSVTWEYDRQPNGVHCYMITLGPDQVVQKVEQVLTEAHQARIQPGMDRDDVRRRLGRPGSIARFDNLGEEIWEWRVEGMPPMDETYFMVHFDLSDGLVKRTSRRVAPRG